MARPVALMVAAERAERVAPEPRATPPASATVFRLAVARPAVMTGAAVRVATAERTSAAPPPEPASTGLIRPSTTNASSSFVATITPINGFAGTVAYSLEGAPAGVTIQILGAGNPSSTLSLNVPATVASSITPYPFKLVATSGTVSRKADMTLSVTGP